MAYKYNCTAFSVWFSYGLEVLKIFSSSVGSIKAKLLDSAIIACYVSAKFITAYAKARRWTISRATKMNGLSFRSVIVRLARPTNMLLQGPHILTMRCCKLRTSSGSVAVRPAHSISLLLYERPAHSLHLLL